MNDETKLWLMRVGDLWGSSPLSWLESQAALREQSFYSHPIVAPGGRIELRDDCTRDYLVNRWGRA